ncbi:MAG: AbrB/MazE/SpoVT family DNA-binding domain-containing protein [bacterium]|nr:AbrB/MazE/SpoVT family DNA-binding domain-containing protein [bacterium]
MEATGLTISSRGYVVLPAKLRKEMNLKAGTRVLLTRENDKIILQPIYSFTEKLSGITRQSFGKTPQEVEKYIEKVRKDR